LHSDKSNDLYLGLISGTSADGIDVALAAFEPTPQLIAAETFPYPNNLRERILTLAQGDGRIALDELGALDVEVGRAFAEAATQLLARHRVKASDVRAIGSHGQTIRHRPLGAAPYTMQIGDPNIIAETTGIATVADFRRRDIAAGGQGAPLAPAFHAAVMPRDGRHRVVLNLGGIANITILPADTSEPLLGFDTGPASCLLDAWIHRQRGETFDRDGAFASSGRVDEKLLSRFLSDPYFAAPPPKSTGREVFHETWLHSHLQDSTTSPQDVQATLLMVTVVSVRDAIRQFAPDTQEILVCGGGVYNAALMRALNDALKPVPVRSIAEFGIDPDFAEAMLFAWLARQRIAEQTPPGLDTVTGARGLRVLGAIYFGGLSAPS
jgi:anhydro-N-acetylmuramic acid kinase